MLRTGQKVECVDDRPRHGHVAPTNLTEGTVYTIRGRYLSLKGEPGVLLEEVAPPLPGYGFYEDRFRPIVDISVFTRMLKRARPLVDA
jgi:hypothetical protein